MYDYDEHGHRVEDRPATESEAHAEWHRNAGHPMDMPGCPWDCCDGPPPEPTNEQLADYLADGYREANTHKIIDATNHICDRLNISPDETEQGLTADAQRKVDAFEERYRAHLTYDAEDGGHVCSRHGNTIVCDKSIEPTESGSWYYYCSECGAGGWSGL